MKKIFGEINLSWPKLIIMAIIAGIYTAIMAMIPVAKDTSFSDLAVTFEVWILFGIFIIMNSKSAKDSALKCLVFFVISQPLIYLVQDLVNHSQLFITYYRNWVLWTLATIPMGYIGYYMKKDKWWGALILAPMLLLLGIHYGTYLGQVIMSFPYHILTTIFCFATMILYPILIFKDKKARIIGIVISTIIIAIMTILTVFNKTEYNTTLLVNNGSEGMTFDDTYKVYLADDKFGEVYITYEKNIEEYMVNARFIKTGTTEFTLEAPDGTKTVFELEIKSDKYNLNKKY